MANEDIFASQVQTYEVDYWRSDEENAVNRFFPNRNAHMLVLGCGAGRTLPHLETKGYRITAIDNVPRMVEAAKEKMKGSDVVVLEMDATKLSFPDASFDYVFFPFHGLSCVHPDIYAAVREIARVLKPHGVFVGNMHNRTYLKKLHRFTEGPFADYDGLQLYRTTYLDFFNFRRYFSRAHICSRIGLQNKSSLEWKERLYRILPFFDKSLYFICERPRSYGDREK